MDNRICTARAHFRIEARAVKTFVRSPTKIAAPRNYTHLFPGSLSDIGCPKLIRPAPIERPPPGVAESDSIDLVRSGNTYIRIVRRVGIGRVRVYAGNI